nr:triose-phosphate isomerase [Oceanococcus sp. HetDA_MAG_MS8]
MQANERRPLVAGNWKMHGNRATARVLAGDIARRHSWPEVEVVICPPLVHLSTVADVLADSTVELGAQNLAAATEDGAHTGEVHGRMLADVGCRYVIVGHSERRADHAETDALVAQKFAAALDAGLRPILCVGETLEQREAGESLDVVGRQLQAVVDSVGIAAFAQAVVAYEPVWAIGTGRSAAASDAQQVHAHLRCLLAEADATIAGSLRILYGGSVKPDTATELFAQADIDGGLIGGAALKAESFLAIAQAAAASISS